MRMADYRALAARIEGSGALWSASIEVTHRCNQACIHCLRVPGGAAEELTTSEICGLLDELVGLGCLKVSFTGGEPLIREDFMDILRYARARGLAFVVLTNGTLIDDETARELKRLHALELQISLYGASPVVHDRITTVDGSFDHTVAAIRLLRREGVRVKVSTPVLAENAADFPATRSLAEELGAEFQWSPCLFPRDDGSPGPLAHLASDAQLEAIARGQAAEMAAPPERHDGASPLCGAGINRIGIGPEGTVYACGALRLVVGDAREGGLDHIWHASPALDAIRHMARRLPADCAACAARPHCVWCPGLSLALTGRPDVPNAQDCRRTRIFHGGGNACTE